jgi:hypothetical protein
LKVGLLYRLQKSPDNTGRSSRPIDGHHVGTAAVSNASNYIVHTLLRARDWQHRPQLDQVCDWWRRGGPGVCALVGMGGAGKTAIAEQFLSALPVGQASSLSSSEGASPAIDPPLPPAHGVFVYSFYEDDKPENFFRDLQIWLEGTPRLETVLAVGQMLYLVQQRQGLMILDGLEKVQESGARGGFGRLVSPSLRDLLNHIACGSAPELSVLVTSRFPLADLRDSRPRFFQTIPVDQIDLAAGVGLLRKRGVRGPDPQLEPIVEQCGRHALTVDLAGGYIKEYGGGNPATSLKLGTTEELEAAAKNEPDENRKNVLKQAIRLGHMAQRYRDALFRKDRAAIALLERICLFRLGVECSTLAAIFTGRNAKNVSGRPLAALDRSQLQTKLDWLVRMRIVEKSTHHAPRDEMRDEPRDAPQNAAHHAERDEYVYSIHPAVREGFLSGISRRVALAGREAICLHLERSLGSASQQSPADAATLDILEEIVHHRLMSEKVNDAWEIYWTRIGTFKNLGWRLGAYERGYRVCREFLGWSREGVLMNVANGLGADRQRNSVLAEKISQRPDMPPSGPYSSLDADDQGKLFAEYAKYCRGLGFLSDAERFFKLHNVSRSDSRHVSFGQRDLAALQISAGRLTAAHNAADDSLQSAEQADYHAIACHSAHLWRGTVRGLQGDVDECLVDIAKSSEWWGKSELTRDELYSTPPKLYDERGVNQGLILFHLGRHNDALTLIRENRRYQKAKFGKDDPCLHKCDLIRAEILRVFGDLCEARTICNSLQAWAEHRRAREVLCWSAMVRARIELSAFGVPQSAPESEGAERLSAADTSIAEGLKIARDCGYGLFHIDLLLERARLHLFRGDPRAALADVELALETGIPADDETGQAELLAANHEACGYAWAIPLGLQLRAEALLLRAAQSLGNARVAGDERSERPADATSGEAGGSLPSTPATPTADVVQSIVQAKQLLHEALDRWHNLRDPEPTEENNFQRDGKEYNYRAAQTYQILVELDAGMLTRYPLSPIRQEESSTSGTAGPTDGTPGHEEETTPMSTFDTFLYHNSRDKPIVRELADAIVGRGLRPWLDERELVPGRPWQEALEEIIRTTKTTVVAFGPAGLGPWEEPEMRACLNEFVKRKLPVIPLLLPGAPKQPDLPLFLQAFTWVDLRGGLTGEGLDRVVWGITGRKPA